MRHAAARGAVRAVSKVWRNKAVDAAPIHRFMRRNALIYEGPSQLTGAQILVIATAQTQNRKVGPMLQLWILPAESPIKAVQSGRDDAVCGDCKMRGQSHDGKGRGCYVEWWRSPENIWQARAKAERMTPHAFAAMHQGAQLRIGAYGDPVAVPMGVWAPLLAVAGGWTAYTHQWRTHLARPFRAWCMASVDTVEERHEAVCVGWRTFRVRSSAAPGDMSVDELSCPASDEGFHRATCATCSLCRGEASRTVKDIAIVAHGPNRANVAKAVLLTRAESVI